MDIEFSHVIQVLTFIGSILGTIFAGLSSYRSAKNGRRIESIRIEVREVHLEYDGRMSELIEAKTAVARAEGAVTAIQAAVIEPMVKKRESP